MITLGSDPEFMLRDPEGELRSAIGIIRGTKDERLDLGDGNAIYYDNVLAECNIRPGNSPEAAVANFRECFERFAEHVAPHKLVVQASAHYPEGECEHDDAKVFGCEPEFCAYTVCMIEPPICEDTFRSAGGHIHIGYDGGVDGPEEEEELNFQIAWNRIWVVRMADLLLGIPSLFLDKDPTSKERRKLYGGAGSHRSCADWGVEYRTLGNFWLAKPSLVSLVYDLSDRCVQLVLDEHVHEKIWDDEIDPNDLCKTINTWDEEGAKKYMKVLKRYVPEALFAQIKREIDSPESGDLYQEWEIKP